jgi:surface-anchored protein
MTNPFAPFRVAGLAGLALAIAVTLSGRAVAQTPILTSGHTDIGVGYEAGELHPHWHTHVGAVVDGSPEPADGEYEPDGLIARTEATRLTPGGGGGLADLLGVPTGTEVWVMGSTTYQPNVGFGTDELTPADWLTPITITFNPGASTLPGGAAFGLYTTNIAGTNVVDRLFSSVSAGATDAANSLSLNAGDHAHFQWAFTQQGLYDLNFTWSGIHKDDGFKTATNTFSVQAVPEPSTIAMLTMAGGVAAAGVMRRRRASRMPGR